MVMAVSDLEQGAPNWLPTGVIPTPSQHFPNQLVFDPATNRQLAWQLSDGVPPPELALGYNGQRTVPVPTYNDYYEAYSTAANLYTYDNLLFSGALMSKSDTRDMIEAASDRRPPRSRNRSPAVDLRMEDGAPVRSRRRVHVGQPLWLQNGEPEVSG